MISEQSLSQALSSKKFEVIILPTEKCNFRCTYCYEDFSIGKMKRQTIDGIKLLLKQRVPDLSTLVLSWFGGEPLLAKDTVLEIGRFANGLCEEHNVSFIGGLTTNAYVLSPDLFQTLVSIRHTQFQVTLDGDREWHDKTRLLANARGTFDTIWGNLLAYKRSENAFQVTLRLHVHRDNVESMKRLYSKIKCEFANDGRFQPYFHKVSNLSGDRDMPQAELKGQAYIDALGYITGASDIQREVPAEVTLSDYICYAARPNSIMIRTDGRIGKCTVALNDPRNDVGALRADGTLDINNEKVRIWFEGYRNMSEKALGCPLSSLPYK